MENSTDSINNQVPRPVFLTVLCILTFISSGMGALSAITTPVFADLMVDIVSKSTFFDEAMKPDIILVLQAGWGYYMATFVLALGSFIGALMMWNLRKVGFHFYAISNLGLLFVPTLFLKIPTGIENIVLTSSIIGMYALYLKLMK